MAPPARLPRLALAPGLLLCSALPELWPAVVGTGSRSDNRTKRVKLIVDTDMSTDCDDVAALCIAHALENRGLVEILAVVHDTGLLEGVGAVSSVNHHFHRDRIPIGAYKGEFGSKLIGAYVPDLAANFPGPIRNSSEVSAAVDVYRTVLCNQPDGSVTVASIGFMTNLEALLRSPAGHDCPLDGTALVAAKVKTIAFMGGYYPSSGPRHEWNFGGGHYSDWSKPDPVSCAATSYVLESVPPSVELIFSGFEVGNDIMSGGTMTSCLPASSPCRQAYVDRQGAGKNRQSWDPSVVLLAVFGAPEDLYVSVQGGQNVASATDGTNVWQPTPSPTRESYLVLREGAAAKLAAQIDELLCQPQPGARELFL